MKKYLSISCGILAVLAISVSCNKVSTDTPSGSNAPDTPSSEKITITATLSDALTKVSFDPVFSGTNPTSMAHKWQTGDKLRITNESSVSVLFDLVSGENTDTGTFQGPVIDGTTFSVEAVPVNSGSTGANQTQDSDGATDHLLFVASATGVTDLSNIELAETSNIIGIIANLPSGATETIDIVEIEKSVDDFATSDKLSILISNPGDTGDDDILKVYANVPTSWSIAADTKMFLRFKSTSNTAHTVYTRYQEFPSAVSPVAGKFNYIKINCSQTDKHAGAASSDGSSTDKAYLIGDKYQMDAMHDLMAAGETKYFKLIDNIDLTGFSWTSLNPDPFTAVVNLDGNNKTISYLGNTLFADFNGTVSNLTIDHATVSGTGALIGIFANTIKTAASSITNVDISNSSVSSTNNNPGSLVSEIDKETTITDCDITNTTVSGYRAGGLAYFFNSTVIATNCSFTGGSVTGSNQYIGGLVGSVAGSSVITNCRVENSTMKATRNQDVRTGGLIGMLQQNATVKGCTVGTPSQHVSIELPTPASGKVINGGGFVGVIYGTITKDDSGNRCKAYATVTCSNTDADATLRIGGFVGFHRGVIEYSDADVTLTDIKGTQVGGFAGYIVNGGIGSKSTDCTVTGTVVGCERTGGFVGFAETGTITNCHSSAVVSRNGAGNIFGSFAGLVQTVDITKCSASSDINCSGSYTSGFIGEIATPDGKTATISKCWETGNVTSNSTQCGGFIGHISAAGAAIVNISDCYATGDVSVTNQRIGGFIGQINSGGTVTVSRCYASGAVKGGFGVGGFLGFMNMNAITIEDCAAWNASVEATSHAQTNWCSGAVVGVTQPNCHATNNYRSPDMVLTAYCPPPSADWDHPDIDGTTTPLYQNSQTAPFTWDYSTATAAAAGSGNVDAGRWAYHGKHVASGTTLSTLASTAKASGGLGWSGDVWDFTGDLPTLK